MHIYGEPVPEGMIPTSISISAPPGLIVENPVFPPTETIRIESMDMALPVWSGTVDIISTFYPVGELASETRPLDTDSAEIEVSVRYQACNDVACYPPKTEELSLNLALDVIDVPALGMHLGHGQREAGFSGKPHLARLVLRKTRKHPLGMPRLIWKTIKLETAALKRRLSRS